VQSSPAFHIWSFFVICRRSAISSFIALGSVLPLAKFLCPLFFSVHDVKTRVFARFMQASLAFSGFHRSQLPVCGQPQVLIEFQLLFSSSTPLSTIGHRDHTNRPVCPFKTFSPFTVAPTPNSLGNLPGNPLTPASVEVPLPGSWFAVPRSLDPPWCFMKNFFSVLLKVCVSKTPTLCRFISAFSRRSDPLAPRLVERARGSLEEAKTKVAPPRLQLHVPPRRRLPVLFIQRILFPFGF